MRRLLAFRPFKTHYLGVGGYKEHNYCSTQHQKTQHLSENFKILKKNFWKQMVIFY